ncbi:type II toxin-antitoxin system RelE/ParE family toxin [Neolewinella litorea]|uniref:Type II toxin-antitoxin system RelE/ParE family toxin n=1 Tax=Neolewinella litorea TaxID=2562452 RepID=A0A4S4NDF2_9BACT|nr:type II toxin-antitoxin system RelE/ParE family toxin [Neolewinella litorea]
MVGQPFRVSFSRKFRDRLKEIYDYTRRSASPAVATKVLNGIREEAQKLEKLPSSRPIYPGSEPLESEVRYTSVWSYKIIFEVIPSQMLVRILTIRHDAEDPETVLGDLE